jgi:CHAT domain-containing protein/tetratricopeptide (TPR) repeat protein
VSRPLSESRRAATIATFAVIALGSIVAGAAATIPRDKAITALGYPLPPGARVWPIDAALLGFAPAADSAWRGSSAGGIAFGDSLLRLARRHRDRPLEAAVHAWRGRKFADAYRLPEGKPDLDTAWTLSSALRDSAGLARVLAARGHGYTVLGQLDDARGPFTRLIPLARAAGLPGLVGFAHRGLGYGAKATGRYDEAARHLSIAIRLLPTERFESRHSRFLLAEVKNRIGRHDEARDSFLVLLDEARLRRDRWLEAGVFNDLGILEYGEGDMAMADRYWSFAAGVFDSVGNVSSALNAQINRAHALIHLGRSADARVLLERLQAEAAKPGIDASVGDATRSELGTLYHQLGRDEQAEALLRGVRASATLDASEQSAASASLAEVLRASGRPRQAAALLDSMLAPASVAHMLPDDVAGAHVGMSKALRALGRPRDALGHARAAERSARTGRPQGSIYWLDAAIELGRCQRDNGAPDSAIATLRGAARTWERWRMEISDLQWREQQGSGLAELFAEYGLALLDPRRPVAAAQRSREAFDALQVFQARTLEERMHGRGLSGRLVQARVTADSLRRGVLLDGELLVDLVATPDTTLAFLVTRSGVSARGLPGASRLERLHDDWRQATLAGADDATVTAGLDRLSRELLDPLGLPVARARRIIIAGGGPIALWPLAALKAAGERVPLGETRELFTVPSATLLASLRASAPPSREARDRLLAIGRTTDAGGRDLPGAAHELQTLANDYAGVVVRLNHGDRAVSDLTTDLPRWDVLHFAAHAEAQSRTPWQSGFLLGRGAGDDAYLRASRIAGMRLRARLAVLSGCQSAGASTLAGEGALGLASAFLCSGARSVVATLWPVEDRVAERFMAQFYASLSRGRTVAAAVADGQRALRARSDTAQARDWAAFVAAGEGATRVPLARRGALELGRR